MSTLIIIAAWAVILIGGWQACRDAAALPAILAAVAIGSLTTGATLCAITAWGLS